MYFCRFHAISTTYTSVCSIEDAATLIHLQAIFESEPKNYNTWCPYFPDRYANPTVDDILRSVTPPGMEVAKGARACCQGLLTAVVASYQAARRATC